MRAMLAERKVDLAEATLPFSYDPELRAIARPLFVQKDGLGTTDMIVRAARAPFLTKNRPAMVDFMEDAVRAIRYLVDPAIDEDWLFTHKDFYRDGNLLPDLSALQRSFDLQAEQRYVKSSLRVDQFADLGIVEEAVERVK